MKKEIIKIWKKLHQDQLLGFYASMGLRTTAVTMVGVFVPFYLYELGFGLQSILGYYLAFAGFRVFFNLITTYPIARFGPKHMMAASTATGIVHLALLFSLETHEWPLTLLAAVYSLTNALFFTSYHVIFSKIKVSREAGKELSLMLILRRLGSMIGPLMGGLLANSYGLQISLVVASILMFLSLAPLFFTKEPVRVHQHIKFNGLGRKLLPLWRDWTAISFISLSGLVSAMLWTLYISLTIFVDNTYAVIGLLSTFAVLLSMLSAGLVGRLTDAHGARQLMRMGLAVEALTGIARLFIGSPTPAVVHNIVRAQVEATKSVPATKGYYAQTDDFPGQRIVYIAVTESILIFVRGVFFLSLIVLMEFFDPLNILLYGSVTASLLGLIGLIEKYKALD